MQEQTSLAKFLVGQARQEPRLNPDLIGLLLDVETACKGIGSAVARGPLAGVVGSAGSQNVQGEEQKKLDVISNQIMIGCNEWTGRLAGMASEEMDDVYGIPSSYARGRYLLVFDPLDGSSNLDVNVLVGSIFSVLESPAGTDIPTEASFLQPGVHQVAAGYALYGPSTMLVLTTGNGVNGFTLDREVGQFVLTHPHLKIPADTREFAINASNSRFWEPPVQRYVEECLAGADGPR